MKAFTLIETIVAVFILTSGVLGMVALINQTISIAPQSSSQLAASYLAQEGLELVRNIRDVNWLEWRQNTEILWDDGLTSCADGCQIDFSSGELAPYTGEFLTFRIPDPPSYQYGYFIFKRKITIVSALDKLLVSSEVAWQERGRDHVVTAETELYDWRKLNE